MTVTSQTNKVFHDGNDSATTFSFSPMVIYNNSDLVVIHTDANGIETTLTEGTGANKYAVTVTLPGTGTITYPEDEVTPLPTGESLTLKPVYTLEQQTELENQGAYNADTLETQLDKLLRIDLQQQDDIDRAFRFPVSYQGSITNETDTPAASQVLQINSAGTAMVWSDLAAGTMAAAATVEDVSLSAGAAGTEVSYARADHVHLLPTVTVAKGGTNATTAAGARTNLGLGTAAVVNTGVTNGDVPLMDATGYPAADGSQITNISFTETHMDRQIFTTTGADTWTKPSGYSASSRVLVEAWGGGGSGGVGALGGAGGGGGGYNAKWFVLSDLGATESLTIATGGASQTVDSSNGNGGGTTSVGALLSAYGGGRGATGSGGGGGGGAQSGGGNGTTTAGGDGGDPDGGPGGDPGRGNQAYAPQGGAGGGDVGMSGGSSVYGGGGGAGGDAPATAIMGGSSIYGGGGGGGGDPANSSEGGFSVHGGDGGAGGIATNGVAGSQPGGGGGGCVNGYDSGAGGDGQIVITVYPV